MMAKLNLSWLFAFVLLAFSTVCPLNSYAQCYLNEGCAPSDDLTYQPNGTGQVYHGDGASNNGAGGWTTNYSDENQCLSCHYGTDTLPYLMTGHTEHSPEVCPGCALGWPRGRNISDD